MKVITIGRGEENQIVLEDSQDMISRQHATLRIHETGKMEIVSTGSNGTFVNGFRIKPNVPYKVTRKDVVSFAHVRQLDWALVPDPFRYIRFGIIGGLVALLVVAVMLLWPDKKKEPVMPVAPVMQVAPVNTDILQEKPKVETPKKEVKEKVEEDSVVPMKRFPTKAKETKKEETKKEQPGKEPHESDLQNRVF